jgi:hypothetical protein
MNRAEITFIEDRRLINRLYVEELRVAAEPLTVRDQRLYRAVNVSDTVFEQEIGDDWRVFYRIVNQDGVPVVGEVRLYPLEPQGSRPEGTWSGEVLGTAASVPLGGITASLLRRVRIDYQALARLVRLRRGAPEKSLIAWAIERRDFRTERRRRSRRPGAGRPQTRPEVLARAAVIYEQALRRRRPPLQAISKQLGMKVSTVRGLVARTRRDGFLEPAKAKQGVLHGRATKRAKALWRRSRNARRRR